MTRNGKIAKLPRERREAINRWFDEGVPGKEIVARLNPAPDVQAVLAREFGGRPITEQNVSEWKQGGYRDWQKHLERREAVRQLVEQAEELGDDTGGLELSDRLSVVLAAELVEIWQQLQEETTDPRERWQYLQEALNQLVRLRREDHKAGRLKVERERWEATQGHEEAMRRALKGGDLYSAMLRQQVMGECFAQPDLLSQALGISQAEKLLLNTGSGPPAAPESDRIRPDPSESEIRSQLNHGS